MYSVVDKDCMKINLVNGIYKLPHEQAATNNTSTYTSINSYAEMIYAIFTHTATRSHKATRAHTISLELVTSSNMCDSNHWWIDVGVSSDVTKLGKVWLYAKTE